MRMMMHSNSNTPYTHTNGTCKYQCAIAIAIAKLTREYVGMFVVLHKPQERNAMMMSPIMMAPVHWRMHQALSRQVKRSVIDGNTSTFPVCSCAIRLCYWHASRFAVTHDFPPSATHSPWPNVADVRKVCTPQQYQNPDRVIWRCAAVRSGERACRPVALARTRCLNYCCCCCCDRRLRCRSRVEVFFAIPWLCENACNAGALMFSAVCEKCARRWRRRPMAKVAARWGIQHGRICDSANETEFVLLPRLLLSSRQYHSSTKPSTTTASTEYTNTHT